MHSRTKAGSTRAHETRLNPSRGLDPIAPILRSHNRTLLLNIESPQYQEAERNYGCRCEFKRKKLPAHKNLRKSEYGL
jgi:hypothetical protein